MKKYLDFINSKDVRAHLEKIGWVPDALCASWLVYKNKSSTFERKAEAWKSIIETSDNVQLDGYSYTLDEFLSKYIDVNRQYVSEFVLNENKTAVYSYAIYVRGEGWLKDGRVFSSYSKIRMAMEEDLDLKNIVRFSVSKRLIDSDADPEYLNLTPELEVIDMSYSSYLISDDHYTLFYEIFSSMTFDVPVPDFKGKKVTEVNGKYYPDANYDQTFIYNHHSTDSMFAFGWLEDEPDEIECYAENYLDLEFTDRDEATDGAEGK